MKRIFISDLHLDETSPELAQSFFDFLAKYCQDIDELYILGDFFEVWLGDDNVSPFNQSVIEALSRLTCKVYIMHGNRDFLIGQSFCQAANVSLLDDPTIVELASGPALLIHGDSLCTNDVGYIKARSILRSKDFQEDFLSKPIVEREAIAKQIRGESEQLTRETADDIMDVTPEEVVKVMQDNEVRVLIHGHTHRPAVHRVDLGDFTGKRFVLGDWHTSMQYLEADDDKISLKLWECTHAQQ
jgi:UDP-2,3-diacylglucosamine hydrolase